MTLDRIDPNGNYELSNCRWATVIQQCGNKRTNILVTIHGRTQCVAAWARELGIKNITVTSRIRRGWSPLRALTEKVTS